MLISNCILYTAHNHDSTVDCVCIEIQLPGIKETCTSIAHIVKLHGFLLQGQHASYILHYPTYSSFN